MKKMFIAVILTVFCLPLVASKPKAEPNPLKLICAVCMIWTDQRWVSCSFLRGRHEDITVVETLPKVPSPFPGRIKAAHKQRGSIKFKGRLVAKYSVTMKTLYSQLNNAHQLFKRLTADIYTDGSVSVQEYDAKDKK